jgi:putative Mg2+ transporter-C (MgtC) family protein
MVTAFISTAAFRQDLMALGASILVGGLIGIERQSRDKAAGLRTMIFICMGATLFTLVSRRLAPGDPVRISAQIVSGIGFLGAGVILRNGPRILGVTTAAVIWIAAALGMGIGAGLYTLVFTATPLVVAILWSFRRLTRLIDSLHEERAYRIVMEDAFDTARIDGLLAECRLVCQSRVYDRAGRQVGCTLHVTGPARGHERLVERLLADPLLVELKA